MNELWPTTSLPDFSLCHSGDAPADFRPEEFFDEYSGAFLPPIYRDYFVKQINREFSVDLKRQWAFEWHQLVERTSKTPSESPLRYWLGTRLTDPRHACIDTEMSEIYRSALLRALAWCVDNDLVPLSAALEQAAMMCPVDIELFKLPPSFKPNWWPCAQLAKTQIDTSVVGIWGQVESLWESHQFKTPFS